MNPKRPPATLVTLVVCALVALGAWTYSSGSASIAGSPVTAAPPTTPKPATGKHTTPTTSTGGVDTSSTTIAAPTTSVASNPHAYVLALFRAWEHRDHDAANKIAALDVVKTLFSQSWRASDGWVDNGCQTGVSSSVCTFTKPTRRYVFEVRTAKGTLPIFIVGLQRLK